VTATVTVTVTMTLAVTEPVTVTLTLSSPLTWGQSAVILTNIDKQRRLHIETMTARAHARAISYIFKSTKATVVNAEPLLATFTSG
jgi:hypothetical protein